MHGEKCIGCEFLNCGHFDEETKEWIDEFECDRCTQECPLERRKSE